MGGNIYLKQKVGLLVVGSDDRIIDSSTYVDEMLKRKIRNIKITEILDDNSYVEYQANIVNLENGQWKYAKLTFIDNENETIQCDCIIRKTQDTKVPYSLILFPSDNQFYRDEIDNEQEVMDYSKNIFHDLRSYLFTISAEIPKLEKIVTTENGRETLEIINTNFQSLSFLIENLGAYAQIKEGDLSFGKSDLLKIISEAGKAVISTIREFKIEEIIFNIRLNGKTIYQSKNAEDIGRIAYKNHSKFIIYCDEDFFKRVVVNVLTNAIKYSRNKNPQEISIEILKENSDDIIRIKDNGIGIRKSEKNKIFQRGFRSNRSLVKDSSGSGIGLDISKKILSKHYGKIKLYDTKVDEYTIFEISLPSKR